MEAKDHNIREDYNKFISTKIDEKRLVAKDYSSNYQKFFYWPNIFLSKKQTKEDFYVVALSYSKFISFYLAPLGLTAVFSSFLYPKIVYLIKKLKFKGFWTVNLLCLPILLFFNVRVFALTQTYIGFKYIEHNYKTLQNETNKNRNPNYEKLRLKKKEIELSELNPDNFGEV